MEQQDVDPEALVSYLLARVEMLSANNGDLQRQVETLQNRVNELESGPGANEPRTPMRGKARPEQSDDFDDDDLDADEAGAPGARIQIAPNDVEAHVINASRLMATAMLMDPGKQPNLNYRGRKFMTALRAKTPNMDKIREMLEADPELREMRSLNQEGTRGYTALHIMAMEGRTEMAEALIRDFGFDPYATDLFGKNALHIAASNLKQETVRMLSSYMGPSDGADAPIDAGGTTPAGHAALTRKGTPADRMSAIQALHKKGDHSISPLARTRNNKPRYRSKLAKATVCKPPRGDEVGPEFRYGHSSLPGYRVHMEDAVCLAPRVGANRDIALFAVFDGHGGKAAADFCASAIEAAFRQRLDVRPNAADPDPQTVAQALGEALLDIDAQLLANPRFRVRVGDEEPARYDIRNSSGTTATVAVVTRTHVILGNLGDSRTVMFSDTNAVLATTRDHCKPPENAGTDPFWQNEVERVQRVGGMVAENGRVYFDTEDQSSHLAMTRALGDAEFKQKPGRPEDQVVIPVPETFIVERDPTRDQFLLLACDGVWDVKSNAEAVNLASTALLEVGRQELPDYDSAAERVALACLDSFDNVTVVLVHLQQSGAGTGAANVKDSSPSVRFDLNDEFDKLSV